MEIRLAGKQILECRSQSGGALLVISRAILTFVSYILTQLRSPCIRGDGLLS